jgi:hypothetical protein
MDDYLKAKIKNIIKEGSADLLEKLIKISRESGMTLEILRQIMQDFKEELE